MNSEALGRKLQIFHHSIASQFPEETWAQRKLNKTRKWPESLGVLLKFQYIEHGLFFIAKKDESRFLCMWSVVQ